MKQKSFLILFLTLALMLPALAAGHHERARQDGETASKEVYTGTIFNMSGRSASTGFTLTLTGRTSDEERQQYLSILASEGQERLLKAIHKNDLGFIAATGQTRRDLLVVREASINGRRRVMAAFERWQGFYEIRGGYRSTDYPFSVIEIVFDEKGRGTGTFIGLAQVKMERDKKNEEGWRLEVENFGSFPSKVMGVMRRK
jgi:hypothetical protein